MNAQLLSNRKRVWMCPAFVYVDKFCLVRLGEARKSWANDGRWALSSLSKWTALNRGTNYFCVAVEGQQYKEEADESTKPFIKGFCPLSSTSHIPNIYPPNYIVILNFLTPF